MAATITYSPRRPPPLTSCRPSSSTLPQSNRNYDFRPRLPSDPFSYNAFPQRDLIVLSSERLFHIASVSQPSRDVILVLGGQ
jgi:hypothetical protein